MYLDLQVNNSAFPCLEKKNVLFSFIFEKYVHRSRILSWQFLIYFQHIRMLLFCISTFIVSNKKFRCESYLCSPVCIVLCLWLPSKFRLTFVAIWKDMYCFCFSVCFCLSWMVSSPSLLKLCFYFLLILQTYCTFSFLNISFAPFFHFSPSIDPFACLLDSYCPTVLSCSVLS